MVADALENDDKLLYKTDQDTSCRKRIPKQNATIPGSALYCITLFSLAFICLVRYSFDTRQQDNNACNMSYMYPSYRHLQGFDHEHTRFASKYSLYLYREATIDTGEELQGVPVLFVPGNAGSYKQIRPIAAEAAAQFQQALRDDVNILRHGKRNLDFFTVDFNEDFSAFHGQTMLDQAEYLNSAITYILSLYTDARKSPSFKSLPDPSSVIIIGHSMGGVVARLTQIMPNYLPKSINTIITMSTPHASPPAPFDSLIQNIYEDINTFWHHAFSQSPGNNTLQDVSLISIAGGGLDTIVSSDYTSADMIVPATNGFTVFTSSIPYVWISADHQAILWCDQFRKIVASALLECVDVRRATQTSLIQHRLETFSRHLLSRIDRKSITPTLANQHRSVMSPEEASPALEYTSHTNGSLLRRIFPSEGEIIDLLHIKDMPNATLQLLTNILPSPSSEAFSIGVSLCREEGAHVLSREGDELVPSLSCVEVTQDLVVLPSQQDLTKKGSDHRLWWLEYDTSLLSGHDFLAVRSRGIESVHFLAVEIVPQQMRSDLTIVTDLASLVFGGLRVVLGSSRSLLSSIKIVGIASSLISYRLEMPSNSCSSPLMHGVTRQHMSTPYESKYFVGKDKIDISVHGQAPFFPPLVSPDRGLTLEHWSDPSCHGSINFILKVDYVGSLGKLVMRYRVVMIVYPFVVALLVVWTQIAWYNNASAMITFQQASRLWVKQGLVWTLLLISAASYAFIYVQTLSLLSLEEYFKPSKETFPIQEYVMLRNDKLLGLQDPFLWWLAPLFLLVAIGVLNTVSLVLDVALRAAARILDLVKGTSSIATEQAERSPKRRVLTTTILLAFVSFLIPYQFAYIVACMVQLATCVRLLRSNDTNINTKSYNFNVGILILMICVLPINIPILVVWIRNIAVQWLTPFSSHHNVLSVAPTMLLVESLSNGGIFPPVTTHISKLLGPVILIMAYLILVYGVMYTYLLHHIFNIFAGCIVAYKHLASQSVSFAAKTGQK